MTKIKKEDFEELKEQVLRVIQATEKALKKHLSLVKKRERIPSIVAMIERLRWDIREKDTQKIREHLEKLNGLTKGFSERVSRKK